MAVMPSAQWRPLPRHSSSTMSRYDLVVIHTMVGSLEGTDGYFRRLTNGINSHFGTGGDGTVRQWVDTMYRSGANGAGNHRAITVENADMGPEFAPWNTGDGNAVPAFTAAQVEANARICAWANQAHGVPLVAATNSLSSTRGIGFHRLGVDPYRVPGGELWSSSYGKVCPSNRRIAQIPQIIARAKQIVAGGGTDNQEWWEMPIPDSETDRIAQRTRAVLIDGSKDWSLSHIRDMVKATDSRVDGLTDKVDEVLALLKAQSPTPPTV